MKRLIATLFTLLLATAAAVGQENDLTPNTQFIPPSPEIASLMKFTDMPVNQYTGIPNIAIPIHTLSGKEVSIPISLNYHAAGLKVGEVASSVGAGWALSAGGSVSRTIMGLPDEEQKGYVNPPASNAPFGVNGAPSTIICNPYEIYPLKGDNGIPYYMQPSYQNLMEYVEGKIDTEPDIFYISLPSGESAKFVHALDGTPYFLQQTNLRIEKNPITEGGQQWIIIDAAGTKYYFGQFENGPLYQEINQSMQQCIQGSPAQNNIRPSSWQLVRMESANQLGYINFTYRKETQEYNSAISQTKYEPIFEESTFPMPAIMDVYSPPPFAKPEQVCISTNYVNPWLISSIETNYLDKVEFIYDEAVRSDLKGGHKLNSIRIIYNEQAESEWRLEHDYFTTTSGPDIYTFDPKPEDDKKLKLESVQQVALNQQLDVIDELPPYTFVYHDAGKFPRRTSRAQDHWGFFNGAVNNPSLVPMYDHPLYPFFGLVDREPDEAHMKVGVLKQIKYPTGGHLSMEYEANRYYNPHFEKIKKSVEAHDVIDVDSPNEEMEFVINDSDGNTAVYFEYDVSCRAWNFACEAKLLKQQPSGEFLLHQQFGSATPGITDQYRIINLENGTYRLEVNAGTMEGVGTGPEAPGLEGGDGSQIEAPLPTDEVYLRVSWLESTGNQLTESIAGGLRIKRLAFFDPTNGGSSLVKNYSYMVEDGSVSSGAMMSEFKYKYKTRMNHGKIIGTDENANGFISELGMTYTCYGVDSFYTYWTRTAQSVVVPGMTSSSPVGYSFVHEYIGEGASLNGVDFQSTVGGVSGKNTYKFTNKDEDEFYASSPIFVGGAGENVYSLYPFVPNRSYSHQNGKLIEQKAYKAIPKAALARQLINPIPEDVIDFELISKVTNTYQVNSQLVSGAQGGTIKGFKLALIESSGCTQCPSVQYVQNHYEIYPEFQYLAETETESYEGSQVTRVKQTFDYHPTVLQPRTITTHTFAPNKPGNVAQTQAKITFSQDLAGSDPVAAELVSRNIIGLPMQVESYQVYVTDEWNAGLNTYASDNSLMGAQKVEMAIFSHNGFDQIHKKRHLVLETQTPIASGTAQSVIDAMYAEKVVLDNYNAEGRPTQFTKTDGITTSILWDESGRFALAQAVNANDNELYYTSFEENGTTAQTFDPFVGERLFSGNLPLTNLGLADGTYRLSYWKHSNGQWQYVERDITISNGGSSELINGVFDEMRICPKDAQMQTFYYDHAGRVLATGDASSRYKFYEYDAFKRLKLVRDEKGHILQKAEYEYQSTSN